VLSTGISVAHSNDAIARTFQEPSPRLVVASLRFSIVHVPLELDHNPFTGAIEIHNKAVQYVLSPKLEPEDSAVAQQRPGVTLSWRRVVAQLAGARKSLGRAETTKRIHLPERAAQRNDLRNQNPAERSEKKTHPSFPLSRRERGSGGEDRLAGQGGSTEARQSDWPPRLLLSASCRFVQTNCLCSLHNQAAEHRIPCLYGEDVQIILLDSYV